MNVELHPSMAKFVRDELKAGRYTTPEEVINGALFVLRSHQSNAGTDIEKLRSEIRAGLEQADRGELEDWDIGDIRAEGRRLLGDEKDRPQKRAI